MYGRAKPHPPKLHATPLYLPPHSSKKSLLHRHRLTEHFCTLLEFPAHLTKANSLMRRALVCWAYLTISTLRSPSDLFLRLCNEYRFIVIHYNIIRYPNPTRISE